MSFKLNQFTFILPLLIVGVFIFNYLKTPTNPQLPINTQVQTKRKIASMPAEESLAYSFKKINQEQNKDLAKKSDDQNLNEEKKGSEDIRYLLNYSLSAPKLRNSIEYNLMYQNILLRVKQNPKIYSDAIGVLLEDALYINDSQRITLIFSIASSLPLTTTSIQDTAENILIDIALQTRQWNEELFRTTLEFYYLQKVLKEDKSDQLQIIFNEKCPDEQLKIKIQSINEEIKSYAQIKEDGT